MKNKLVLAGLLAGTLAFGAGEILTTSKLSSSRPGSVLSLSASHTANQTVDGWLHNVTTVSTTMTAYSFGSITNPGYFWLENNTTNSALVVKAYSSNGTVIAVWNMGDAYYLRLNSTNLSLQCNTNSALTETAVLPN